MYHKKEVYEKRFFSVLFYRETTINVGTHLVATNHLGYLCT